MKRDSRSLPVAALAAWFIAASASVWTWQDPATQGSPLPFEDPGACPFEGCVYREWTAEVPVQVRAERRIDAPVSYELQPGEKITAVTGIVVTLKAGRVQFRKPRNLRSSSGEIHIEPGETLTF